HPPRRPHASVSHARELGADACEHHRAGVLERTGNYEHAPEGSLMRASAPGWQVALHPGAVDARHRHGRSPVRGAPPGRSAIATATAMRRSCEIETVTSPNPMASARADARPCK